MIDEVQLLISGEVNSKLEICQFSYALELITHIMKYVFQRKSLNFFLSP